MMAGLTGSVRIGLVGLGAIGEYVSQRLTDGSSLPNATLAAVLVQRERDERPASVGADALLTTDIEAFFAADWSICVEVAGQPWIQDHGRRVLEAGRSLLVTSVGALTDDALHNDLIDLAAKSGGRLLIAAGAMPGMDWMSSAALDDIEEIVMEQRKKPEGWKGTPADGKFDLDSISEPTAIFEGCAREAASQYPKNANISASLALATIGLDRLFVRLYADPTVTGPTNTIKLKGAAGELSIQVKGAPLSQRTSRIVPLSVLKALRNLSSPEFIGI
eukprot:TRINITY_DN70618_c0_g1_i1.p1 TRINITY_DN70618_c0_g1~~TRINITY_DN70618_c0_g1_i1.p1  ORF type:complete len:290 (-),score=62.66 TRINITY_DN70618_c0_g1_i1:99-926(-)